MKKYWKDNNLGRKKRHVPHWLIIPFLVLCCCLAILAIGLTANNIPVPIAVENQHNDQISTNVVTQANLSVKEGSNADETSWYLVLVNKWNYIPDNYEVELTEFENGQSVDKRIYSALQEMFDTAKNNDIYPILVSGYRTTETQQRLMVAKIADYKAKGYSTERATSKAEAWVAIPGTSEHQLGIAVDIGADRIHSSNAEVYEWLYQNSYKFGFIRRYSADKTEITGVINEPWHYRYVGVDTATEIYNQGICLEEYLNKINEGRG